MNVKQYKNKQRALSSKRLVLNFPATKKVTVTKQGLESVARDVIELVLRKNADYGDAWQKQGGAGWAVRLSDKLCRIENLSDGREALVLDEDIDKTLEDAVGYCLLGMFYRKHTKDK